MYNKVFALDTSVFIEAARRYYAFDIAPKFWECLIDNLEKGRVISIDKVEEELMVGKDTLAQWAKEKFSKGFALVDKDNVRQVYREVINWVQGQKQFLIGAQKDFAKVADGWLVAFAKANGYIVVTQEVFKQDVRAHVPIPNVCKQFDVDVIDTFGMLRELGVRF